MNPRTAPLRVLPDSWQKGEYVVVVVVSAVCSVSSIFFTLLNGSSLTDNLITIHAIGFSQLALSTLVRLRFRGRLPAQHSRPDRTGPDRREPNARGAECLSKGKPTAQPADDGDCW
jgi:hypothetical protein